MKPSASNPYRRLDDPSAEEFFEAPKRALQDPANKIGPNDHYIGGTETYDSSILSSPPPGRSRQPEPSPSGESRPPASKPANEPKPAKRIDPFRGDGLDVPHAQPERLGTGPDLYPYPAYARSDLLPLDGVIWQRLFQVNGPFFPRVQILPPYRGCKWADITKWLRDARNKAASSGRAQLRVIPFNPSGRWTALILDFPRQGPPRACFVDPQRDSCEVPPAILPHLMGTFGDEVQYRPLTHGTLPPRMRSGEYLIHAVEQLAAHWWNNGELPDYLP